MNSEMGFSLRTPASDGACLRDDPRGARHWGASSRRTLHMRAIGVKRALHCLIETCSRCLIGLRASPRSFFSQLEINYLPIVGPVELWATRLRRPSAAANPQGFCWPLRPPLARQRILPSRSPRYTATSGVDKLKRDRGSEGARHWGASSRRKLRGTIKIVIFRRALPLSNPWLEPIVDCGL